MMGRPASAPAATDQRRRELAQIHLGRAKLGWSEDDYRYHLRQITGADSAADLDAAGRRKLLDHMGACGFKSTRPPFDQAAKIAWLWKKLHQAGGTPDGSNAALLGFVGRVTGMGVSHLKFLTVPQASNVIEGLKARLNRAQAGRPQ
jgi:hypothetical protein